LVAAAAFGGLVAL